jgi:putative transposase
VVGDNGSELTSSAILTWADAAWHYIAPASPCSTFIERFNTGCGMNC